jgi:hypothetical protein
MNDALKQLTIGGVVARERLALDLVFGQDTNLWTDDMRSLGKGIARDLAPVMANQALASGERVPCKACNGAGNILRQSIEDFFPVPVVCEECEGEGSLDASIHMIRSALKKVVTKKQKKTK